MSHMTAPRSDFRVLIVEDHALFAESLELALTIEGYDVRRVSTPTERMSPGALLTAVMRQRPRIALLDLDLGLFGDGGRLIAPLARGGVNVVVVTGSVDKARWGEAVRNGARTVVAKSRPLNDILATVRRINQGLPVMKREEREELLKAWASERSQLVELQARMDLLTVRERQVLGHLMEGRTVREIAVTSFVSEATVRTQVKSILAKLEVSSQLAAVGLAHHVGWSPPRTA
jgi:two-component system, NarL family, nitrate/nitrite response regulator NarL